MKKIEASIRIQRPVEQVYAYATAFDTLGEWRGDTVEAEKLTEGPVGVGTRLRVGGRVLGRSIGMVVEVTAMEPGSKFEYKGAGGPLRTHNVLTFEPVDGGTQVTWTDEIELQGMFGLFEPLMGAAVRLGYEGNLAKLKAVLEARPAEGA